jgi:hypothetical protein
MSKCYFEIRKAAKQGSVNIAADMMRHLHTRQYLGKALVVCEHPSIFILAARKQWLRLSREIQKQRLNTLDADKILKYTHTITHMQHLGFSTKTPLEDPQADVFFVRKDQLEDIPTQCRSVYVCAELDSSTASSLLAKLSSEALIIDYQQATLWHPWHDLGCKSKRVLEAQVAHQWAEVEEFLATYHVSVKELFEGPLYDVDAMDNALDTLLARSHAFLQVADNFRRVLELARPLRTSRTLRRQYDALTLLAHRVQALSGDSFTQRFLETYNEDDGFLLYDPGRNQSRAIAFAGLINEALTESIARHLAAGRHNLAGALRAQTLSR